MKKQAKQTNKTPQFNRPVEKYFYELDQLYGNSNLTTLTVGVALTFFGIMGLIWMIPFPQFDFLVKMNAHTFLNWGSFFIAIVIYSYLKLAPTLSYAVLFCIGIMSYFIVQLEYLERDGGPSVILVCSIIAIIGLLITFLAAKKNKAVNFNEFFKLLTIGPVWLWSKMFDKLKWKY
ncbi:hypothetical protein GQF61_04355 [Sphingobacterium sp. DK4209]|uniref:DUF962 domain-containing protein n=1 Tax=Sphingobacterium zhuxiongii TaxID=2662364 RepID=A0A5Q0QAS9_9SPHI|nr:MULTISPECIES: hypothetical protein [unclassified Sphingobacterium]MVZ65072.1 hypothetical protein [Sphingobacterium sp. DK4209]QGA26021.1 hypothetical protein GFH32_06685 [Sphingobacterium sp. dk4302]